MWNDTETARGEVHLLDSIFGEVENMVRVIGVYVRYTIDLKETNHEVFKAPDDEDEHSASAPLLSVISGGRATSSEEERELWEAEGPNSELRGTLLDGIANVHTLLPLLE
jgi:hypothetical protein